MALVSALTLAQQLGKRFSLCSVAPSIRIIFELTQLDRVFEIFDNAVEFEAAIAR
jgi:anti-anti-sigma regulatory factor